MNSFDLKVAALRTKLENIIWDIWAHEFYTDDDVLLSDKKRIQEDINSLCYALNKMIGDFYE